MAERKTYNFGVELLDISGEPIRNDNGNPILLSEILGNMIKNAQSEDSIKAMCLAIDIYRGQTVVLDAADVKLVEGIVKTSSSSNLVKAALLNVLRA